MRTGSAGDRSSPHVLDLVGLGLVLAAVAWTSASAVANDGSRPGPTVAALVGVAAAVAVGRVLRRRWDAASSAPAHHVALTAVAGVLLGLLVGFRPGAAGGGPLGYGNANGTLFGLVTLAATGVVVHRPSGSRGRAGPLAVVAVALLTCALTGSVVATSATVVALILVASAVRLDAAWLTVPAAAAVVAGGLGVVAALAVGAGPAHPEPDSFGVRVALWRNAVELGVEDRPFGVGPGRFQDESTVSADPDLRRVHSAPLQQLAEQGGIGAVLLLALGGWAVAALWAARDDPLVAVGAGVLVLGGLQGSVDWVLAEPAVSLTAALLVGMATRPPAGGTS